MTATQLTPAAKEALRKTIRGLRETLITQLKEEAERVYRLGVPLEKAKLSEERAKRRERLETWADEQSRADWAPASSGKAATGKAATGKAATKAKGEKKGEPTQPGNKPAGTKAPSTTKPPSDKVLQALRERYLLQAVKEAAHTFINRLIILRILEEGGLSKPAVLTGGYKSKGYTEFKEYAGALCETLGETSGGTQWGDVDGTKGYAALLQLLFDELSVELPGVFGRVGLTSLFPIPAATLREVVEALNDPALESAWGDDTTLGWVYQFWNDPEREALDEKINGGGKILPHEIASKTQMFTERYMVEWLLQNSLGQTWLAMCKKHGWTPEFEQVRAVLDERRAEWRKKREAGEVAPDELMPIYPAGPDGQLEERWKYWVPQVMPEDAPAAAPDRLRDLKLLDPACGSGHFLVIAFDLLAALYQEEARHLAATGGSAARAASAGGGEASGVAGGNGEDLTDPVVIAAQIVEYNLHGVDIDTRAVQIAAAALWLKAKLWVKTQRERAPGANGASDKHGGSEKKGASKHGALDKPSASEKQAGSDRHGASPVNGASGQTSAAKPRAGDWTLSRINLVAPNFKLAGLAQDDPALLRLKQRLRVEVGIPESLTESLVGALGGVDHLGSLLRVDKNVRQALATYEIENFGINAPAAQTTLFADVEPKKKIQLSLEDAQARVMKQLAKFLDAHEGESDLGLRLEGEQLAAGVRFLQMVQEGRFDIVVGNPPYQGTSKMAEAEWFKKHYPRSKADLYACFLERGLELVKQGGVSALLTMRGWMFLSSYQAVREHLLQEYDLRSIGDFDRGAFDDVPNEVLAVSACTLRKAAPTKLNSVAAQPTPSDDKSYDRERTGRKRAAVLAQVGRFEFDVAKLAGIEGTPLIYWWDNDFLDEYVKAPKLGEVAPGKQGMSTANNGRFLRKWHEVDLAETAILAVSASGQSVFEGSWVPYLKGAAGKVWFEPLTDVLLWGSRGELRIGLEEYGGVAMRNPEFFFRQGVAFPRVGAVFSARLHRFKSVFDSEGASLFPESPISAVCLMNAELARRTLASLNPSVHFQIGDVLRLPLLWDPLAEDIGRFLGGAFSAHESHREPSVEFKRPGPSPWRYAQDWAQRAVDRAKGEPLPPYEEQLDPPEPASFVSFAIGVALGRFGENGEGILDLALNPVGASTGHNPAHSGSNGARSAAPAADPACDSAPAAEREPAAASAAPSEFASARRKIAGESALDVDPAGPRRSAPRAPAVGGSRQLSHTAGPNPKPTVHHGALGSGSPGLSSETPALPIPNLNSEGTKFRELDGVQEETSPAPAGDIGAISIEPSPLPDGQVILPHGILFISAAPNVTDSTAHPAFKRIEAAWSEQMGTQNGAALTGGKKTSLEDWLRLDFFAYHKSLYENRPIYFPLSSEKRSFVAWVSIHRWADNTLQALLASYLHPAREKLQGEINDLNRARVSSDKKTQAAAEKQYAKSQKLFEELEQFISDVTQIAEKGAPPTEAPGTKNGCPPREVDAPFEMDLDDGVMINSAALWPLLLPQWKDPKKWWKELCTADGRKDYDWAHLAARYFPTRVDAKCKQDPSLGVAHGCFWKYHPAKAYAWELRLQDEIGPDFTIDEVDSDAARDAFLRDHATEAAEIRAKEEQRRERKRNKADALAGADGDGGDDGELFRDLDDEGEDAAPGAEVD